MRSILFVAIVTVSACGSTTAPFMPDAEVITLGAMSVAPATVATKRGLDKPTQLTATATLSNGKSVDVTLDATWTSSDETVAVVSASGLVSVVGAGTTTITANYESTRSTSIVTASSPRIYLADAGGPAIAVFDAFASGDTPPLARIGGSATTLSFPWAIAVANDEIYVSDVNASSIDVWAITATGNVAPSRRIVGALTKLSANYGLAVYNHEIYVSSDKEVLVFPDTASGNVAPTREIVGASTGLSYGYSIEIDQDELYVSATQTTSILVFPANASGNLAPIRKLMGTAEYPLSLVYDFKVAEGELYVAELSGIRTYLAATNGQATPIRYLVGTNTNLNSVIGVNVVGNELFTVNFSGGGIHAFPRRASGNTAPIRGIGGAMTTISSPRHQFVY